MIYLWVSFLSDRNVFFKIPLNLERRELVFIKIKKNVKNQEDKVDTFLRKDSHL